MEELATLLTEKDAPFRMVVEEARWWLGVQRGGFSSDNEMESWIAENPGKISEATIRIFEITMTFGLNESQVDFVSNFLFFGRIEIQETNTTVISNFQNGDLSIVVHGGTTLDDLKKAWETIERLDLRKHLYDYKGKKFKPIKDLDLMRRLYEKRKSGMTYQEIVESEGGTRAMGADEVRNYVKRYMGYACIT